MISIVAVAVVVTLLLVRYIVVYATLRREADGLRERVATLEERAVQQEQRIESMQSDVAQRTTERDVARSQVESLERSIVVMREESQTTLEQQIKSLKEMHEGQLRLVKENTERLMEQLHTMNKRQAEDQITLIKEQMQTTSERVLKMRQQELGEHNAEQMAKIVDPINLSLKLMREALDNTTKEHHASMVRLDATIDANMKHSHELGETADRLTRALLGNVKVQGNFGELKLKQLLDDLGLKENEQYTTQQTLTDKYGRTLKSAEDRRMVPDFILHFPNNRDVIVDSKVCLQAYERYINCDNEVERIQYAKEHIANVREQVRILARKDYSNYLDSEYTKLNFVIMYMFHEGALNLALLNDTSLWKEAYDSGVLIMGPQTMYMNLRVLELMWTQSRQLYYQKSIIKEAETMIERVHLFAERFRAIEKSLADTQRLFDDLKVTTANGGKSIITSARNIIAYGIKEDKKKRSLTEVYVEDDAAQMIGDLADGTISSEQMTAIPEASDEALEKKYKK